MLKACLECIAGCFRSRVENEEVDVSSRMNGNSQRAPPWPVTQLKNEIMFVLPKQLSAGDQITVAGNMINNPQTLTVSLITGSMSPDYQNIACQLEASFPANPINPNRLQLKVIQNGSNETIPGDYQSFLATELFTDLSFKFGFSLRVSGSYQSGHILEIYVGESYLEQIILKHNIDDIRFLSLSGDVAKVEDLEFKFA
ncbi:PREDICTED: uncharacterized protein LOC106103767 isoform X1 [Papilio polytes]|uniref:uncharacterized protein LOC106103767 isoform X1 n=2 Tax=Papilio polytes TaxID=76194 RepID=UPI0006766B82|nr:PREDICTED: uncharacterized protein LOC106103767 isoform X1 [Papilio polytes]